MIIVVYGQYLIQVVSQMNYLKFRLLRQTTQQSIDINCLWFRLLRWTTWIRLVRWTTWYRLLGQTTWFRFLRRTELVLIVEMNYLIKIIEILESKYWNKLFEVRLLRWTDLNRLLGQTTLIQIIEVSILWIK